MQNTVAQAIDAVFSSAEKAADGLHLLQTELGILYNTESLVRADLRDAREKNNAYQAAKTARLASTGTLAVADDNALEFITATRDVLKQTLGQRYSQAWDETGFTNRSIAVPKTMDRRRSLLKSLELYLTQHPDLEVTALKVTRARAAEVHQALSDAITAVNVAWSDQREQRASRDEAMATLRQRLRKLASELRQFLPAHDPRWLQFGFNVPSDTQLPNAPEDLVVKPGSTGHLLVQFTPSPRADRFRIYKQVIGVDPEPVLTRTVTESSLDMNSFTPGAHVRVTVSAVNGAGESQWSEPVEQVVG